MSCRLPGEGIPLEIVGNLPVHPVHVTSLPVARPLHDRAICTCRPQIWQKLLHDFHASLQSLLGGDATSRPAAPMDASTDSATLEGFPLADKRRLRVGSHQPEQGGAKLVKSLHKLIYHEAARPALLLQIRRVGILPSEQSVASRPR